MLRLLRNRPARAAACAAALLSAPFAAHVLAAAHPGRGRLAEAVVEGAIDPGSGDYIKRAIERAQREGYEALIVKLDTPGGLLTTTREIVQAELESHVPIVVWVAPSAARAGSAGVFITLAAHVAAMAPATNIGAAHPVSIGPGSRDGDDKDEKGKDDESVMSQKIENDTAAFVEAIAKERGRNVEWAVSAVRESKAIAADKAVELKVVDFIAADRDELLKKLDGRRVELGPGREPRTLHTAGAPVDEMEWSPKARFLHVIGEPTIAGILLSLGALGLLLEFYKPGAMVPGITGAILLLLGVVGISALPVNVGAVALLLLGIGLFVAELFVSSFGVLGVAGAVCFAAGGILLVDNTGPDFFADRDFGVSPVAILPTSVFVAIMAVFVGYKAVAAWRMRPVTGDAGLVGETGEVREEIAPGRDGRVFVHGELWNACADRPLAAGQHVKVVEVTGLKVRVEPDA